MNLTCPYCRKHLHIAEHAILSESGRIAARRNDNPGRKPVMRKCPKCGLQHSAREMRKCKSHTIA